MNQGMFPGAGLKAVDPSRVIDLTNAAEDYLLAVGETAKITYSSALSVPLHVATVEGAYELIISGSYSGTQNDNWITLIPNSGGLSGIITDIFGQQNGGSIGVTNSTGGAVLLQDGLIQKVKVEICTRTLSKNVQASGMGIRSSSVRQRRYIFGLWPDTTTPWTSLGTLDIGTAQSGQVIIKRIL